MATPLVTVIFRLEKLVDKKLYYIEFQRSARNGVKRLWNVFNAAGLVVAKSENENFNDSAKLETYIKNQRAAYEKQGFKEPESAKKPDEVVLE